MKNLRLTILHEPHVSKAELANIFGEPVEINMSMKYLQFKFEHIHMLTSIQLTSIYNLLLSYEKQAGKTLRFKMFHLYDEASRSHSPISLQYLKGVWTITSSMTGIGIQESSNLLTLI